MKMRSVLVLVPMVALMACGGEAVPEAEAPAAPAAAAEEAPAEEAAAEEAPAAEGASEAAPAAE
jgi:hypothetical protein